MSRSVAIGRTGPSTTEVSEERRIMSILSRHHVKDLQGLSQLLTYGSLGVTGIVERMHHTILSRPGPLGAVPDGTTSGITGLVYRSIRGGMRLVGGGVGGALSMAAPLLPEGESGASRQSLVSALNGVYGDHLEATENPLALEMTLRQHGRMIDPRRPAKALARSANGKLLLLVHGLCLSDLQWQRQTAAAAEPDIGQQRTAGPVGDSLAGAC
jgi:hypothetical protein